jgi:hypothetical protein
VSSAVLVMNIDEVAREVKEARHFLGPTGWMTTGTERGGIRITLQGLSGRNSTLTLLGEGPYTPAGLVGFLILRRKWKSHSAGCEVTNGMDAWTP